MPVAFCWILLSAHESYSLPLTLLDNSFDISVEFWHPLQSLVYNPAIDIELFVIRMTSQVVAKIVISYTQIDKSRFEGFAIEIAAPGAWP